MTFRRVASYVGAEPFRPFRINMTSGKSYEIRHPEMIAVGRTTVHVFTALADEESDGKDRQHELSILLIESIEPLDAAVTQ
ncbi:MAG: hypothetical protein KY476_16095 [Planctomycetes bacterium]|nr:hypothetical protein [Planctomycetota bacterium]